MPKGRRRVKAEDVAVEQPENVADWGPASPSVMDAVLAAEQGLFGAAGDAWDRAHGELLAAASELAERAAAFQRVAAIAAAQAEEARSVTEKAERWRRLAGQAAMGEDGRFAASEDNAA